MSSEVKNWRVFNQYYSYTIYVWLWYKLTFLITITVHNAFKNTLTFSCLQYFEQIRFVIFKFLLQKTWRNIQSCSTIIFLYATFSNILKYKYICNFKVNYYITCHWISITIILVRDWCVPYHMIFHGKQISGPTYAYPTYFNIKILVRDWCVQYSHLLTL
jgi:hypothetical protein